ncbi:MAG: hypothetical protein HQL41_19460, partial [Alphaproteobacteria bacterium]|nr:hypothetical protein [Alphaproteobacteria bacterium]
MPTPRSAGPAVSPPPFLAFVVGSNSEAITSRFAGFNPASNSVPKMDGSQILDLKPAERQDLVDRLVNHQRAQVHARIYDRVTTRLTADEATALEALLVVQPGSV